MPPEDGPSSEGREEAPASDEVPAIEDAYTPDAVADEEVGEDDPQLLDSMSRSLESAAVPAGETDEGSPTAPDAAAATADNDDTSDTGAVLDEPSAAPPVTHEPGLVDWDNEVSAQRIVVELKRIETEIRQLLDGRDSKRKRKLGGTRRWLELEEDIIAWHYSGRIDEATLQRLQELIVKRHHLFRRLRFLAATRPTWNT